LLYLLRIIRERTRPVPKKKVAKLTAFVEGNSATVRLGDLEFFIRTGYEGQLVHDNFDFALFGAMALGISQNIDIETDLRISSQTLAAVRAFNDMMVIWNPRKIYPISISANNVYDAPEQSADKPSLFCLSGGVDSTYTAITTPAELNLTHGMLIAGADYPADAEDAGFKELSTNLQKFVNKTGHQFFSTETNLRDMGLNWELMHIPLLMTCLSFHASVFGKGVISADMTPGQEMAYHPWSNVGAVVGAMSTPAFPILHWGRDINRTEKVLHIANDPRNLLDTLSVCNLGDEGKKNCGTCEKCVRTKLNLLSGGLEMPDLFVQNSDLAELVDDLVHPKSMFARRRLICWIYENEVNLPDGDVKGAVVRRRKRLRGSVVPLGRI